MRLIPALWLVTLAASPGLAQTSRDSAVAQVVATLSPGTRIRVGLLRERWTGRFQGYNGDTLFLGAKGGPSMAIRFNAVDTLWIGDRAANRGAMIGAISGAVLGAIVGVSYGWAVGSEGGSEQGLAAAGGGAIGALGGAATGLFSGMLVGLGFREWKRVVP